VSLYVTRLGGDHDRKRFQCGRESLDEWFRHQASQADRRHGSARALVLVDDDIDGGHLPLGYYALAAAANFFERYGFVPLPGSPLRLVARLRDIRTTFGLD
jgi:hypothetical protein